MQALKRAALEKLKGKERKRAIVLPPGGAEGVQVRSAQPGGLSALSSAFTVGLEEQQPAVSSSEQQVHLCLVPHPAPVPVPQQVLLAPAGTEAQVLNRGTGAD